jgi:hypothetical protein
MTKEAVKRVFRIQKRANGGEGAWSKLEMDDEAEAAMGGKQLLGLISMAMKLHRFGRAMCLYFIFPCVWGC